MLARTTSWAPCGLRAWAGTRSAPRVSFAAPFAHSPCHPRSEGLRLHCDESLSPAPLGCRARRGARLAIVCRGGGVQVGGRQRGDQLLQFAADEREGEHRRPAVHHGQYLFGATRAAGLPCIGTDDAATNGAPGGRTTGRTPRPSDKSDFGPGRYRSASTRLRAVRAGPSRRLRPDSRRQLYQPVLLPLCGAGVRGRLAAPPCSRASHTPNCKALARVRIDAIGSRWGPVAIGPCGQWRRPRWVSAVVRMRP